MFTSFCNYSVLPSLIKCITIIFPLFSGDIEDDSVIPWT